MEFHGQAATDQAFVDLLPVIERESDDDRNYVRKAVNWALRQIGKRNRRLHKEAARSAKTIAKRGSKAARWIAADALRELESEKVREKLK